MIPLLLLLLTLQLKDALFMEDNFQFYRKRSHTNLLQKLQTNIGKKIVQVEDPPKNVILFIGDGMGITAITAARIAINQANKNADVNEDLFFESFPYTGIVKTACHDQHVTDSAAGAVAMLTGWKVVHYTIGRKPGYGNNCTDGDNPKINDGIPDLAVQKGVSVGVVTTSSITDATPAAMYAKDVYRYMAFNSDKDIRGTNCTDIAAQTLLYPADKFKVLFGGGKKFFTPVNEGGSRTDDRNLVNEWTKKEIGVTVGDINEFHGYSVKKDQQVLGLFAADDIAYRLDDIRNNTVSAPRLFEMAEKAVRILENQSNSRGYFLLIEGALIDKAEHLNKQHYVEEEMREFDLAIKTVSQMVGDDTLVLVTADHSHAMSVLGSTPKSSSIYDQDIDMKHSTNLSQIFFSTGPGFRENISALSYTKEEGENPEFVSPAAKFARKGSHGGDDVGIWAKGPYSWLFSGSMENTQIAHTIKYLMCLEEDNICQMKKSLNSEGSQEVISEEMKTTSFSVTSLVIVVLLSVIAVVVTIIALFLLLTFKRDRDGKISSQNGKA